MFPPAKKKPAVTVAIGMSKPKPSGMGGKPNFGKPKPPMADDELDAPDPAEGKADNGMDSGDDGDTGMDDGAPDMTGMGQGYGAKLEKDIEDVGAALGMEPGQAKKAAGAFFAAAAQCLSGGDDEGAEGEGDAGMIDTEGAGRPGRYGA